MSSIRITYRMEDQLVEAVRTSVVVGEYVDGVEKRADRWVGFTVDLLKGESREFKFTDKQMAAIVSLGLFQVGEDNTPGYEPELLYAVANEATDGWPHTVRPYP